MSGSAKFSDNAAGRSLHRGPLGIPAAAAGSESLEAELFRTRRDNQDLLISLQTSNEHGDMLQDQLYRLSAALQAEVRERQSVEQKLHSLIQAATQEKADLEVLVQILIDQGDDSAEEGGKARIDSLTGIANRRRFDEHAALESAAHEAQRQPLTVMLCDVDHFKRFNDRYGHPAGDKCLRAVAERIASTVRSHDLTARYGGEEFAILLSRTDLSAACVIAERVRTAVAEAAIPHADSPVSGHVTLSIGIASGIPHGGPASMQTLIQEADQHLYLAKRSGRNRVAFKKENFENDC